jgi:putative lipoprotein
VAISPALACTLWVGLWAGCATAAASGAQPAVTGTLSASGGFALAPGGEVEVTLADISLADAPAVVLARESLPVTGAYWLPFSLPYRPADILPNHTYVVSARVKDTAGKLRYLNREPCFVLTRGAPSTVQLQLDLAERP